jgi:cellulose 1,4-beta-cellobiosidase
VDDYFSIVKTAPLPVVPAAPASLTATAGNAVVNLSWSASSNATSYSVKRASVSGGPYATIASGLAGTSYSDTAVSNGSTYYYVVSASNANGEGANSTQSSATPTAPPALPAAPTTLKATAASRTQINLTWTDNASNETGFLIERSTKSGSGYVQIATVGSNVTSFANTGLSANKSYYYRIRASNGVGNSAYSNTATAKTPR